MAQVPINLVTNNSREGNNSVRSNGSNLGPQRPARPTRPSRPRVVVDATHPRFLKDLEKPPVSVSASTDDGFCEQCKSVIEPTTEAIRHHFRTIMHNSSLSCTYCRGVVYEYFQGNEKRFAHDCDPKAWR